MSINLQNLVAKATAKANSAFEKGETTSSIASKTLREIPDEVYSELLTAVRESLPIELDKLPDSEKAFQTQCFIVPNMIILLSEKGFFKDEIAYRLGFDSENSEAKQTFSDYFTEARKLVRNQIAVDVLGSEFDTESTIPSPDPNNNEPVPFGQKLLETLSKHLFSRDTEAQFTVPVSHKKKKGPKITVTASEVFGTFEKWESLRNTAAAKYKAAFPTKTGGKTSNSRPSQSKTGYVSSVIAEMI